MWSVQAKGVIACFLGKGSNQWFFIARRARSAAFVEKWSKSLVRFPTKVTWLEIPFEGLRECSQREALKCLKQKSFSVPLSINLYFSIYHSKKIVLASKTQSHKIVLHFFLLEKAFSCTSSPSGLINLWFEQLQMLKGIRAITVYFPKTETAPKMEVFVKTRILTSR